MPLCCCVWFGSPKLRFSEDPVIFDHKVEWREQFKQVHLSNWNEVNPFSIQKVEHRMEILIFFFYQANITNTYTHALKVIPEPPNS